MPNNSRTHTDGSGVWADGYAVPASDWQDLERKIFGSINGDKGGAYCPPPSGGSAFVFDTGGLDVTGPTRLTYGGAIYGGNGVFSVRDGAFPLLKEGHAGRTRSIVCPIHTYMTQRNYLWSRYHPYTGVGSVALACRTTYGRVIETADLYVPLRVIDGATITKVAVQFRVASRRVYAPIAMPKVRILRVPRDSVTNAPLPLKATADGTGFDFLPLVTTPTAWYQDGNAQTFTYVCDQNNVIDVANYSYVVHIVEETGALTPEDEFDGVRFVERKADVLFVGTNDITLNGSQTVDGQSSGTSASRILIVDTDDTLATGDTVSASAQNGIWLTDAANWLRTDDLDEQADFTPNWIIKATNGPTNAECCWQCVHPGNRTKIDLLTATGSSATKTQPRIVPAEPKGNIWHSLTPTFELTDLRFQ